MKGKALLIVGLGVGYVLGARAGRERYDQIAAAAGKVWNSPPVKRQVDWTIDHLNGCLHEVTGIVSTGVRNVVGRITGGRSAGKASQPVTPPKPSGRPKPGAASIKQE